MIRKFVFLMFSFFAVLPLAAQTESEQTGREIIRDLIPFWQQALGGAVIGLPSAQAGSVVMVCEGGLLKAYSWEGRPLWTYHTRGRFAPFITRSLEGTCYVSRPNGTLIAVNRTGRELWQIDMGSPLKAPVLCGFDGRLFVFLEKKIACFTASGFSLWQRPLESPILLQPVMDDRGGFMTVLENGELLRLDAFGKINSWQLPAIPIAAESIRVADKQGISTFVIYRDGKMELIAEDYSPPPEDIPPAPGATALEKALTNFPGRPLMLATRNGVAALVLENGQVLLMDPYDGKILWTGRSHINAGEFSGVERPGQGQLSVIFDERGIFVLSKTGATGFTEDGRRLWLIRLNGATDIPVFSDEGVLYSGARDWVLYAYRAEEQVRAQKQSLYGPAPAGNYGTGNPPPSLWADDYFQFDEGEIQNRLGRIQEYLQRGMIGMNEKEYTGYLMEIAGSFPRPGSRPGQVRVEVPVHILHRARAARLLSFVGSRETIPFLAELFTHDPDPNVKAAAAEAIGRIGVDPEGIALRAFSAAIFPPAPLRDEQVLAAVASSTAALCRFSGPPLSETGIRLLIYISGANHSPAAQTRAKQELRTLVE
ncbi:hypothetical protein AGMMS49928_22100 [Spirochaetia bacterium]|nr:hypothetical protein AGMMS49928_22100 [Spirochaetia bacterium]